MFGIFPTAKGARRRTRRARSRFAPRRLTLETLESRRALTISGALIEDSIFPAGSRDEHRFQISEQNLESAGGQYFVTLALSAGSGQFQPRARLYAPSQTQLGSDLDAGSKSRFTLRDPGEYVIRVRDGNDRDTGYYSLALEGLNPPSANARTIEVGQVQHGTLAAGGIHTYQFTAEMGDVVAIALAETNVASVGYHPRAELYHSGSGERIGLTSAATGNTIREMTSGRKYISPPLSRDGTYLIQVYDNNYSDTHANGYYVALAGLRPASPDAEWIVPGELQSGVVDTGQIDTYRFTGNAGDVIAISLSDDEPGLKHQLWAQLFAPSGQPVPKLVGTSGPSQVENGSRVLFELPETATEWNPYVLQVHDNNFTDREAYGVMVHGLSPPSAGALDLVVSQPRTGTLDAMGQVDAYTFTLTDADLARAGGQYPVKLSLQSRDTVAYKPRAVLFSPAGRELDEVRAGRSKQWELTQAGTYGVHVHDDDFTHTSQELILRGRSPEYVLELHDILPPWVESLSVSQGLLTAADAGSRWSATVVFSETMRTETLPSLVFTPPIASGTSPTLIAPSAGTWSETHVPNDTWTIDYEVVDRNVEIASVRVGVAGARDLAGNLQQAHTGQHALQIDTRNPGITQRSPAHRATRVPWDTDLVVTFHEPIQTGTGYVHLRRFEYGQMVQSTSVASSLVTVAGSQATIRLEDTLADDTRYYVEMTAGAFVDSVGNPAAIVEGPTQWNFTTVSIPGQNPPFVARSLPDRTFPEGVAEYEVDLQGVFDDPDIPAGDALTLDYHDAIDNTNPAMVSGHLENETLILTFASNAAGSAELTVRATDLAGQTASERFTVRVVAAPVANDNHVTTDQNVPVEIAVYENDTDADGWVDPQTVTIVPGSGPASGTIVLDRGIVTYTPAPNFSGTDSFRYTIRDNDGFTSNQATVFITVRESPPFHNAALPGDVNNSGYVSPHDALIVINYLNTMGSQLPPAPLPPEPPRYYYDVTGDNLVTPLDVLTIINILNQQSSGPGEGESAVGFGGFLGQAAAAGGEREFWGLQASAMDSGNGAVGSGRLETRPAGRGGFATPAPARARFVPDAVLRGEAFEIEPLDDQLLTALAIGVPGASHAPPITENPI